MLALRKTIRRQKRNSGTGAFSLILSLLLNGAIWLATMHTAESPNGHIFLLVDSGEQAVELTTGSLIDSRSSVARVPSPPEEQRFEDQQPKDLHIPKKETVFEEEPSPLSIDASQIFFSNPVSLEAEHADAQPRKRTRPGVSSPDVSPTLPATLHSRASESSRIGSSDSSRGVRRRARQQGAFQLIYPHESRVRDESGMVLVTAVIAPDGRCISATIERSSGYSRLDQAALDTVMRAPFYPALLDGHPVVSEERLEFVFELN